jgi:hypothetical protein
MITVNRLRMCRLALVLLLAPWLSGCLVSARPDVAPADLLSLPLAGDYGVLAQSSMFEQPSPAEHRARIETLAPGSYRLTILPPEAAKEKQPVVYPFRVLGGGGGEYLAIYEGPVGERGELLTAYVLIRAAGPDVWSINTAEPRGDVASLLRATQAVGLGLKLRVGLVELTGKLTAKALVELFQSPQFREQLVLTESWKIRARPGQGFSPSDNP